MASTKLHFCLFFLLLTKHKFLPNAVKLLTDKNTRCNVPLVPLVLMDSSLCNFILWKHICSAWNIHCHQTLTHEQSLSSTFSFVSLWRNDQKAPWFLNYNLLVQYCIVPQNICINSLLSYKDFYIYTVVQNYYCEF